MTNSGIILRSISWSICHTILRQFPVVRQLLGSHKTVKFFIHCADYGTERHFSLVYLLDPHQIPAISRVHLAVLTRGDTRPAGPMSKAADIFYFCICSSQKDFSPNEVQSPKNTKPKMDDTWQSLDITIPKNSHIFVENRQLRVAFFLVSAIKCAEIKLESDKSVQFLYEI